MNGLPCGFTAFSTPELATRAVSDEELHGTDATAFLDPRLAAQEAAVQLCV